MYVEVRINVKTKRDGIKYIKDWLKITSLIALGRGGQRSHINDAAANGILLTAVAASYINRLYSSIIATKSERYKHDRKREQSQSNIKFDLNNLIM